MGVVAGLRSMTAPAVVSWAARLGWLHLENTSRKAPVAFVGRILTGALCGAALGAASQSLIGGLVAGMLGGVAGPFRKPDYSTGKIRAWGSPLFRLTL
jgi:uncharacterized membrane protein